MGTTQSGVNFAQTSRNKQFENFVHNEIDDKSLIFNTVGAIYEDREGDLWIGTDGGGLDCYTSSTGNFTHYTADPHKKGSIGSNSVLTITEDSEGNIWVGGYLMGISIINKKTDEIITYKHDPNDPGSLSNDDVRDIFIDKKGIVWIATNGGGLNRFDTQIQKFSSYQAGENEGIVSSWCLKIFEDSKGYLWIGTYFGISIFDRKSEHFLNYVYSKLPKNLSNNWVYSFAEDDSGKVWIGTSNGLNYYDWESRNFKSYFIEDGLPNNCINGLLFDNNNNLWLSTNKGISKFNKERELFTNYNISDGLSGNQFFHGAYFKSESGKLYFGGYKGLTFFHPDSIKDDNLFPPVYLTDLLLFHTVINPGDEDSPLEKSITVSEKLVLSHKQTVITLRYAALEYINARKIQYAYYLDGFSEEWDYVGERREVTFTNLDPGSYNFMVKASNADGIFSDDYSSIEIVIVPPIWQTWWFKVLAFLLFSVLLISIYFNRVRFIRRRNKILEETVRKRTFEISNKNIKLVKANELLGEKQEEIISQNEELEKHRNKLESLVKDRTLKLEKALEKAKESDELKSAFLANMSHEIRTPMNAIIGFSGLLNEYELSANERAEYIQIIQSNSDTLLKIIDEILDLSVIEANQLKITKETFALNSIIDHLYSYYHLNNQNPKIEIRKDNALHKLNLHLHTDSARLKQIIINLMDNACKFTPKGYVQLGTYQDGTDLFIYVEDTGKGIPADDIENIFERFRKATDDSANYTQGVGLGLAISQKIANSLGGILLAKSTLKKGSVFTFRIPLKKVTTQEEILEELKEPIIQRWHGKTIMIVEDEEANYLYLAKVLEKSETNIIWAKNGKEAFEQAVIHPEIDLILMDIKMPIMDGYKAAKAIKEHNPDQIIIAQTAYARPEERLKFSDANFDQYISKPIDLHNLLQILEEFL